jgi:tyrosyl-tRNA synthetase
MLTKDISPILKRGCVSLVSAEDLSEKLSLGRPLRVKLGVDPTSPDLHLGHSVVLSKLRAFQDLGHIAVLIIGDFTALIGDPSGRDSTRPPLAQEEILKNAETYQTQAFKILDKTRTELRYNSEWLKPFMEKSLLETLKFITVQQLLAREDFKLRLKDNLPLTMLETLYPIFQGQDSVAVKADIELAGNDQLTNLLMGRRMQELAGQRPQTAMTFPLLVGLDGVKKMSKSYGNSIGLTDSPRDMFGKTMSLSDLSMISYYELLTSENLERVKSLHPMDAKKDLAQLLTARFHGEDAGKEARSFFEETFSKKKLPTDVPESSFPAGTPLVEMILKSGAAKSKNEARRLIIQGAVRIDGEKILEDAPLTSPRRFTLQVGKHHFLAVELVGNERIKE